MDRLDDHTILLVEDEPFIQMDIQQCLEVAGARVVAARNVQEALGLLDSQPITASIPEGGTADDLCQQLPVRDL